MEQTMKNDVLTVRVSNAGGALTSIQDSDGREYLWQGDPAYWSGQAPVLFPICGSIRGDRAVTRSGKALSMPRHGIVRKRDFEPVDAGEGKIAFAIESDMGMLEQYPYPFRLTQIYSLDGPKIEVVYRVENTGNETMPYQIGGHPGFNCPIDADETYEDYELIFETPEKIDVPEPVTETGLINIDNRTPFFEGTSLPLTQDYFAKDAVVLDDLKSRSVVMQSKKSGRGVKISFEELPYLILWSTANRGPFLAIEPWSGLSTCSDEGDTFEDKRGVFELRPGKSREHRFTIEVL